MAFKDPAVSTWFGIEFQGQISGAFRECAGLGSENEVVEYKASGPGAKQVTKKVPGRLKWNNITLKRGITQNPELVTWLVATEVGDVERRTVSIVLLDELRQEAVRWNLREAWASKWMGPDLKANASEMAIETLEITHEGLVRQ